MTAFIPYMVKVIICSGVLYAYYALALRNSTFHHWNRCYLLLSVVLSLLLPLLQIPVSFYGQTADNGVMGYTGMLIQLQEFIIPARQGPYRLPGLIPFTGMLYLLVATWLIVRMLLNWGGLYRLIRRSRKYPANGYRLIRNREIQSSFSFFSNIFWSHDMATDSKEGQQVLLHELAHVRGKHSADKLLMEIICAIFWINPFFYLLRRELYMVHEFIADRAAALPGQQADYAQTILQMTLRSRQLLLTSNLLHQPLKRRINMLLTQKTNFTIMKKLIVLPIFTALVVFISCRQQQETKPGAALITEKLHTQKEEVFTRVEQPPVFPGGNAELFSYFSKNVRYPHEAKEQQVTGTVLVNFVVNKDGSIGDIKTLGTPLGAGLEEEAVRVVKNMPKWKPGIQNGREVAVEFNLPLRFALQ